MRTAARFLPEIHATRPKIAATNAPKLAPDIQTMDLFVKVVDHVSRLRSRVDGVEVRLKYLETLLERQGGR
jgi:hypothetical protein